MNKALRIIGGVLGWLWAHTAAGVALVLIVAALVAGYEMGRADAPAIGGVGAAESGERHEHSEHATSENGLYTCSMHPSVKLPDPEAKCPICHMDLIPLAKAGGAGDARRITMSEGAAAASRIETAPVRRFFPTAEVRLYGKVTYDQTLVARLTAYFPGRIERLFANYPGVPVAEGEHVAEIYSPELIAAVEELRQAQRAAETTGDGSGIVRRSTRDMLVAAREKLRLFGLTEEQIRLIERGELDPDRLTIYAPIGGIVTDLGVREGSYVETGQELATVADLSRVWLDLEAYESQLPKLRWGQRVTFTVEAQPGETFEGRISFIEPMVDERTRTAAVRVAVDNREGRLKPGMFASAVVRARLGEGGALFSDEFAGRWVSPMHPAVVKDGPGRCDVCGMELVPAESLGVVGDSSETEQPLVIPRSAVLFTGTRSVVYVAVPEAARPTYEGREVVLGPRAGELYVVREGLREGEEVVVNGAFRVDSAMQIAAKPSMMMPDGGQGPGSHAGDGHAGTTEGAAQPTRVEAPDSFIFSLKPVYAAYFDAQTALAVDDLGGFNRSIADLRTALGFVEEAGLVGAARDAWRRAASKLRVEGAVGELRTARAHFEEMSDGVISLQRRFGHHGSETWHLAHCPMAFEERGADWLQRGTEIVNPYMGVAMPRCGTIEGSFAPLADEWAPPEEPGDG